MLALGNNRPLITKAMRSYRYLILGLAAFLSSCSIINLDTFYDANPMNIPLHKEKNELKGTAGYGSILGFNADASYAISNNIVIKGSGTFNHQYLVKNRLFGGNLFDLNNHYLEGAVGYFKPAQTALINNLEWSTGYGNGLTDKSARDRYYGRYHKFFLQFNAGHKREKFEYGFGLRYNSIYFPSLNQITRSEPFFEPEFENFRNLHLPNIEIAAKLASGGKKIKFTFQYGLAIPLAEKSFLRAYNNFTPGFSYWSAICNVGMQYNFVLRKQEKP